MAFVGSTALAPSPARFLLLQPAGGAAAGGGLLLQGAGRALVAVVLPRCTARGGDHLPSDDTDAFSKSKGAMEEALDAVALPVPGAGDQGPGDAKDIDDLTKALAAAMEEARLTFGCTAVVLHGDKLLVEQVSATVVLARDLLAAMAEEPLAYTKEEVVRVAAAFADVEAQCEDGHVTADGLLGAMDGLRSMARLFLGTEAAAALRPYRASPTAPLSAHDDKVSLLWDLAHDFAILVEAMKWAARGAEIVHAEPARKTQQFLIVHGDKELLDNLTDTALDAQTLLAKLLAKAVDGPFPITEGSFQEVVAISKSFVKLEAESAQGFARADTIVAAMDGLKAMTAVFAGTAVAAGLRPYNPWPAVRISGEDDTAAYMWNLAFALGILFQDAKFRCGAY
ncbi:unnamed protein product [Alopecurus aequalis]